MPNTPQSEAIQELAKKAFDFAARHPSHPLAPALRSKSAAALGTPPMTSALELKILLDNAMSIPDSKK